MNSELTLLKFINHYTTHNRDDNGEKYSNEQCNLILTFSYSIVEKIDRVSIEKKRPITRSLVAKILKN